MFMNWLSTNLRNWTQRSSQWKHLIIFPFYWNGLGNYNKKLYLSNLTTPSWRIHTLSTLSILSRRPVLETLAPRKWTRSIENWESSKMGSEEENGSDQWAYMDWTTGSNTKVPIWPNIFIWTQKTRDPTTRDSQITDIDKIVRRL